MFGSKKRRSSATGNSLSEKRLKTERAIEHLREEIAAWEQAIRRTHPEAMRSSDFYRLRSDSLIALQSLQALLADMTVLLQAIGVHGHDGDSQSDR